MSMLDKNNSRYYRVDAYPELYWIVFLLHVSTPFNTVKLNLNNNNGYF